MDPADAHVGAHVLIIGFGEGHIESVEGEIASISCEEFEGADTAQYALNDILLMLPTFGGPRAIDEELP